MARTKKVSIPKTLGGCADRLYNLRAKRLDLMQEVDEIKHQEFTLTEQLIAKLGADNAEGVTGRKAKATIIRKKVAQVSDWTKFYAHVLKTKDFSLMQRRVAQPAITERWDDGKKVPGVVPFDAKKVSLTKR